MAKAKKLHTGVKQNGNKGPAFVINAKQKAALLQFGTRIADAEIKAGATVRDVLMEAKGKRPEEIAVIVAGFEARWKAHLNELAPSERKRVRQSVYNRVAEAKAVLRFWANWHGLTEAKQKAQAKHADDCTSLNALVAYARKMNAGGKATKAKGAGKDAADKRRLNAWSNETQERLKAVQNDIRFAPLAALLKLQDFIGKMVNLRRKIEAKGKGEVKGGEILKMLRKAA